MRIKVVAGCLILMVHLWPPGVTCTNAKRRWPRTTVKFDDTCPRDCSQTKRRIDGDDTIFNCSVGNLAEVEKFRKNYKTRMEEAKIDFDPPKLIGIGLYHKQLPNYKEAALNITFRLPKGKTDSYNEIEYPLAIFLNFTSVKDSQYSDKYYSNNLRQRIFRFWDYKPKTNFDSEYPREISYDCMVGLDDSKPIRVYEITLETAFGRKVMYNCTVYGENATFQQGRDAGYIIDWRPTIATSLSVADKSIHVVFDEYPHVPDVYDKVIYYNVSLLDSRRHPVKYQKLKQGTHETVFGDLKHGTYYIRVAQCEETLNFGAYASANNIVNDECISLDSYAIDAAGIPKDIHATPITYTEDHDTLYVAMAVVLGCLIGITLVAALILVILKARRKPPSSCSPFQGVQKPTGLLLSRSTSDHTVVEKFALYLRNVCDCFVYADVLETDIEKLNSPEQWLADKLSKASFVIVVCSVEIHDGINPFLPTQTDSFYTTAVSNALDKKTISNNIRIIPVRFSLAPNETIPDRLVSSSCHLLMEDMYKLYKTIHPGRNISRPMHDKLDCKTYYTKSREGSDLKRALDVAKGNAGPKVLPPLNSESVNRTVDQTVIRNNDTEEAIFSQRDTDEIQSKNIENVMDKFLNVNLSQSSINTFASAVKGGYPDSDSDSPESEPLLDNQIIQKDIELKTFHTSDYWLSKQRQRHFSEGIPSNRGRNCVDGMSHLYPHPTLEEESICSLFPEREFSFDHTYSRYGSPDAQLHHNKNTYADSEQRNHRSLLSKCHHDNPHQYHERDQHYMHLGISDTCNNLCPLHGIRDPFHSPDLKKTYKYSVNEQTGPLYGKYIPGTYHYISQDQDSTYAKTTRDPNMQVNVRYKPVFDAVDPHEQRTLQQDKNDVQIDSGYKSEKSGESYKVGTENETEFRNPQNETRIVNQTINDNDKEGRSEENQTQGGISSAGRYSYPLSLSSKRDFHSDMFIPPEDIESCYSGKDGSSNEIMDQLAEINIKNKD